MTEPTLVSSIETSNSMLDLIYNPISDKYQFQIFSEGFSLSVMLTPDNLKNWLMNTLERVENVGE